MVKAFLASAVLLVAACGGEAPPPPSVAAAPLPPQAKSGIDRSHFDPSVKPSDNFFAAANGGWVAKTEIPGDKADVNTFALLYDVTQERLQAIVQSSGEGKVADFYASFMDEQKVESLGGRPLAGELARVDALKSKSELPALFAHYVLVGQNSPLGVVIHQDNKDATKYILDLEQAGLSLPDRDYYLSADARFASLRRAYAAYASKNLALVGGKGTESSGEAVLAFETKIAQSQWTNVDTRDAEKIYNKLDLPKLKALAPGFDWGAFLKALGVDVTSVVVGEPSYFTALAKLVSDTPLETWKLYLKNLSIHEYSPYLSKAFVDTRFELRGKALQGMTENRPRWKRGIGLVEDSLGEALGQLYVAKYFPPGHKARMEALVANLVEAYRKSISSLDWMSPETKKTALAKLEKFTPKIGYPDKWRDYSALEIKRDDLFGNVLRAREFETRRNLNKLGKPVEREEWLLPPQTIDAFYNPELNDITFPAGILQPPFFDIDADDAVNYGAIGAVIGHEIGHGFDDQGSKYDGAGNLDDWWTKEDRARFDAKTKRLIEQYNAYEPLPGYHVNGALTVGENIADLGGVSIAVKAYHLSLGGRPAPMIDGLTGDQRLFYGWAEVWKDKIRDEALINQLKSNPHAPSPYRVNGVVSNVPEFYSAFGVKAGNGMWKPEAERVTIW